MSKKVLGFYNPLPVCPHELLICVQVAKKKIDIMKRGKKVETLNMYADAFLKKNAELLVLPVNKEEHTSGDRVCALNKNEYIYGSTKKLIANLEEKMNSGELSKSSKHWVKDFLSELKE